MKPMFVITNAEGTRVFNGFKLQSSKMAIDWRDFSAPYFQVMVLNETEMQVSVQDMRKIENRDVCILDALEFFK